MPSWLRKRPREAAPPPPVYHESEEVILGPTEDAEEHRPLYEEVRVQNPVAAAAAKNKIEQEQAKRAKMGATLADVRIFRTKKFPLLCGSSLFHQAARNGDLELMKRLVEEEDCDIDEKVIGCTPLHYAVFYNNIEIVKYLVSQSVDLNQMDLSGLTALSWSVERYGFYCLIPLMCVYFSCVVACL